MILRNKLGLRYQRVKQISANANSERSLVLRQQFALQMLDLLDAGKRIVSIDESWLSDGMFIRRRYNQLGTSNSIEESTIQPRISIIGAIDTEGDAYVSLT